MAEERPIIERPIEERPEPRVAWDVSTDKHEEWLREYGGLDTAEYLSRLMELADMAMVLRDKELVEILKTRIRAEAVRQAEMLVGMFEYGLAHYDRAHLEAASNALRRMA